MAVLRKNDENDTTIRTMKFFDDLKEGLEEALAYEKGKRTLRSRFISLPKSSAHYPEENSRFGQMTDGKALESKKKR